MKTKTEKTPIDQSAEAFFIEWYNDFLTVKGFAAYHGIPENKALKLIEQGRIEHGYNKTAL